MHSLDSAWIQVRYYLHLVSKSRGTNNGTVHAYDISFRCKNAYEMPIIIGAKLQINFQTQLKKIRRVLDVAIFLQYFIYALY